MVTWIIFIDCLGYDEASFMAQHPDQFYIGRTLKGSIASGIPRVTPYVVTGILTGKTPMQHGLLSPVRWKRENVVRPFVPTLIEEVGNKVKSLNFEYPMTMNLEAKHLINIGGSIGGVQQIRPAQLAFPRAGGNMWKDDREKLLQAHVDQIRCKFASLRNMVRNDPELKVVWLSIRSIDAFGHFLWPEYRWRLIQYVDMEVEETAMMGDLEDLQVVYFSDHGICEKKAAFYINKWFQEKGWLNLEMFIPGIQQQLKQAEDPMEMLALHSPLVHVKDNSYFISTDAFDSGIKILRDDAPVEELKKTLMELKYEDPGTGKVYPLYNGIYTPEELYGEGEYRGEIDVDLVCDRGDGILVAGNIHPNLTHWLNARNYCQCAIRNGVHNRFGCWGGNMDWLEAKNHDPLSFHHVLRKVLEVYNGEGVGEEKAMTVDRSSVVGGDDLAERLAELGYA